MSTDRSARAFAWGVVGLALLGETFFGAMGLRLGRDVSAPFLETRGLFFALVAAAAIAGLLALPRERHPARGWCLALLALPAWLAVQLVPLPVGWVDWLSPQRARLLRETWPGPIVGCDGTEIVAAAPPALTTLTVDPSSTVVFATQVLAAGAVFLLASSVFLPGSRARRAVLTTFVLFTGLEAAYGIAQWAAETPMVLWRLKDSHLDSASGTLINRNHYALLLYLGMGCALTLLARRSWRPAGRSSPHGREPAIWITIAAILGLQLAGVIASQSRAGAAASIVLMVVAGLLLQRGDRWNRALAFVMLVALVLPAGWLVGSSLIERVSGIGVEWSGGASRGAVFRDSLGIARDFPLFGSGGWSFAWIFSMYRSSSIVGRYTFAHNDYLQVLIECGLIGLVLALLPIALYVRELRRARPFELRDADPLIRPWPLWVALALVAVHELVDFGLQIPGNLVVFALLAGAARVTTRPVPRPSRWLYALAAAVVVATPAAALGDLAQWPVLLDKLSWPELPESHHQRQFARFDVWRQDNSRLDALCEALDYGARAQSLRPLAARYGSAQARASAVAMLSLPDASEDLRAALERQALRASDLSRLVDPWNPWIRRDLMTVSLSLGALDRVSADASMIIETSPQQAGRVVETLVKAGMPYDSVAQLLGHEPDALRAILQQLRERQDWATARELVPADVSADDRTCRIGHEVAMVLNDGHEVSPVPFLRACLELQSVRDDASLQDSLRVWLARQLLRDGDLVEIKGIVAGLREGASKVRLGFEIANREGDWNEAVRLGNLLLDLQADTLDIWGEAMMRSQIGDAYAHLRNRSLALRQYQRAVELDPSLWQVEAKIRGLERGQLPFEVDPEPDR